MIPKRDKPPAKLPEDAQALWPELVDELADRGTLRRVAVHRLMIYCQLFAQYFRCTGFINEFGQVLTTRSDKGEVKRQEIAPEAVQQRALVATLQKFDKEFGFTEETQDSHQEEGKTKAVDPFADIAQRLRSRMAEAAQTNN